MHRIVIETPSEFNFRTTLLSHGWIQLAPFRASEDYTQLSRIFQLASGAAIQLVMQADPDENIEVIFESKFRINPEHQRNKIRQAVHHMFNLDLDLREFYDLISGETRYDWIVQYGAGRLLRSPSVWEDLVKTLMTTNTNWGSTVNMVKRITALGDQFDEKQYVFPTPAQIAGYSLGQLDQLIRAGYRTAYLLELAEKITSGEIEPEKWVNSGMNPGDLYKMISSLKGFGPYAAGSILKLLGKFDNLALDSEARAMFAKEFNNGDPPRDDKIAAHYERYGHWKGLVIWMDVMRDYFFRKIGKDV